MMRIFAVTIMFAIALTVSSAQELIETQEYANRTAGRVVDTNGDPVKGVDVTLHNCLLEPDGRLLMDEKNFGSAKTDRFGRFTLSGKPPSPCLFVYSPGFNPMRIKVNVRHHAPSLTIKLHIAA